MTANDVLGRQMCRLVAYDLCYSKNFQQQFSEYSKYLPWQQAFGIVICLKLESTVTAQMLYGIRYMCSDLFKGNMLAENVGPEIVIMYFVNSPEAENKNSIVEKCGALFERLRMVLDVETRIGIGDCKPVAQLQESLSEAEKALLSSPFSIVHFHDVPSCGEDMVSRDARRLDAALAFIRENYSRSLSLVQVSDAVGVSPNYFSVMFKIAMKQTYIEYLTALRIEKAKALLDKVELSVRAVGEEVGYPDPTYFCRVFKRATGLTPAGYRLCVDKSYKSKKSPIENDSMLCDN